MRAFIMSWLVAQASPSLTLEEALARARAHPRLQQSQSMKAVSSAQVTGARAGFLPTVSGSVGYQRATGNYVTQPALRLTGRLTPPPTDESFPFYSAVMSFSQPLWDFGRSLNLLRSARLGQAAAQRDVDTAAADVVFSVKVAYYDALAADALLTVAGQTIAQMTQHLERARALVEVGSRPRFDVTRAEVDLQNARIAEIQAKSAVVNSRAALSSSVGVDSTLYQLVEPAETLEPERTIPERVERALRQRPEPLALSARIAAQEALVAARKSNYWPSLNATGQLNWRGADFPLVRNWQAGATLSVPLLVGGLDYARVQEEEARLESLRAQRANLALEIRRDIEESVRAWTEAKARREVAKVLVVQAQENLELAEGRYAAGAGNNIEVADAQAAMASARGQQVRARYDVSITQAQLARSEQGAGF